MGQVMEYMTNEEVQNWAMNADPQKYRVIHRYFGGVASGIPSELYYTGQITEYRWIEYINGQLSEEKKFIKGCFDPPEYNTLDGDSETFAKLFAQRASLMERKKLLTSNRNSLSEKINLLSEEILDLEKQITLSSGGKFNCEGIPF